MNRTPETATELSLNWVNEVIPHTDDACQALAFETDETFGAESLYCDVARVTVTHSSTNCGTSSMIVKFPSQDPKIASLSTSFRFYEKEARVYELLSEQPELPVPTLLGSYAGHVDGVRVVVLEDMSPAKPDNHQEFAEVSDVAMVLEQIAEIHALFWRDARVPVVKPEEMEAFGRRAIDENWDAFTKMFGGRLGSNLETFERLRPALGRAVRHAKSEPATLVHNDLHRDNILFTTGPGRRSTIIDWQTGSSGLGAWDVSNFVINSLSVEERRSNERKLLSVYFDRLTSYANVDYDFDRFFLDYRACAFIKLLTPIAKSGGMGGRMKRSDVATQAERQFVQALAVIEDLDPLGALDELGR